MFKLEESAPINSEKTITGELEMSDEESNDLGIKKEEKKNDSKEELIEKKFEKLRENNYDSYLENMENLANGLSGKGHIERIVILEKAVEKKKIDWEEALDFFEKTQDNGIKLAIISVLPRIKFKDQVEKKQAFEFLKNIIVDSIGFKEQDDMSLEMSIAFGSSQKTKEDKYILQENALGEEGCECEGDYFVPKAIRTVAEMGDGSEDELLSIWSRLDKKLNSIEENKNEDNANEAESFYDFDVRLDARGNMVDFYYKDWVDSAYWEKELILDLLVEKKSQRGIDFFLERLKSDEEFVQVYQYEINRLFKSDEQYTLKKITEIFRNEDLDEKAIFRLITTATDVYGELFVRDRVNALVLEAGISGDEAVIEKLEHINSFITPNGDKKAIRNLQEFYQTKIKFEDYKINERMNEREVGLLQGLIDKDGKILEMGCGAGRLIIEMAKSGYDVSGYDYTERHAQITKEKLVENKIDAKVFQGDWHHNALKDESFDAVYSLGRNILHDYSIISQAELFKEASRILKDGGKFIFDIPNRKKGGYKELVEGYANEMKKRGIDNFRYGAIYDSPDGINFATRYAYSPEDIMELANLTGFEISEVRKEKLETGKDDENLYYVLVKKSKN